MSDSRLNDHSADDQITSGLSVPAGWSVSSFTATRLSGFTFVELFVTRTGADIAESPAGSGNLAGDPTMCTLPDGWEPPRPVNCTWGNGSADGEATIVTSGAVQLRSISGSAGIATGTNVRITALWPSENGGLVPPTDSSDVTSYAEASLFWVTGAAGDGVSNDGPAIQAALDAAHAAGGGMVVIPAGGTYGVNTFLRVYDDTVIWAYGATIKAIANTGVLRNFDGAETFAGYSGHSHITILGGTWDGNAYNGVDGTVTAETNIMNFVHAKDITVRDARLMNTSTAHALEFNAVDGGRALNCDFYGFEDNSGDSSRGFSEAIQIDISHTGSSSIGDFDDTPAKNITIDNCRFGSSSRCGPYGRAVGSHTIAAGVVYENIRITDITIEETLQEGIYGYSWRRAKIVDNIIQATGDSGILLTLPNPATTATSPDTASITGNLVEGAGNDSGIRVISYAAYKYPGVEIADNLITDVTGNGIHVEHCDAPRIADNTVETTSSTGIYAHYSDGAIVTGNRGKALGSNGINVAGSVGASVTDNTVDTTSSNFGIFVGQGADAATNSTDAYVAGNRVIAAASAGIRLSTNATDCVVCNNRVRKGGGATANGISLAASATGARLLGNDFSGNSWSAATAMSVSTAAPITGPGGMQALPGSNLVDTDVNPAHALEAAFRPSGRYETCSRLRVGTESTPSSGWLYLVPIWLPKGKVVSNIGFISGNTGASGLTNHWFTLHDLNRVALARTADATTAAWAASTAKELAIAQTTAGAASSYTTLYAGYFYLGVMIAGTTPPSLLAEGRLIAGAATAPGLGATNSGQTTPPTVTAGAFTAAAFSGAAILAYGYVN
ncbi:right-handed parallel beta-helix repeat-containing protein [Streptomyces nigra]|uniref:right-handed parallel beta-helix repeat-containing protein n=1 Tax=Streptomyces nigra TaxID=1827580 RepID=UPI00382C5835